MEGFLIFLVAFVIFGLGIALGYQSGSKSYQDQYVQDSIHFTKKCEWEHASDSLKLEIAKRERGGK